MSYEEYIHLFTCFPKVHHILAEIIQGGIVLDTNVEEISTGGKCVFAHPLTLHNNAPFQSKTQQKLERIRSYHLIHYRLE